MDPLKKNPISLTPEKPEESRWTLTSGADAAPEGRTTEPRMSAAAFDAGTDDSTQGTEPRTFYGNDDDLGETLPAPAPQEQTPDAGEDDDLLFRPIWQLFRRPGRRPVIAVAEDETGILIVRRKPNLKSSVQEIIYVPFPEGVTHTPEERISWIAEVVRDCAPDWKKADVWVHAPADTKSFVLDLPNLEGEELDAVALLQASQQGELDPEQMRFDYRVSGIWNAEQERLATLAIAADRAAVDTIRARYAAEGLKITGITSHYFSVSNLVHANALPHVGETYVVIAFTATTSLLCVFAGKHLLLERPLGFGTLKLAAALEAPTKARPPKDAAAEGDESDMIMLRQYGRTSIRAIVSPSDRRMVSEEVERLLHDPNLPDEDFAFVEETLSPILDRMVSYIERSVGYFERRNYTVRIEGVTVAAPISIVRYFEKHLKTRFELPTVRLTYPDAKMTPEATRVAKLLRQGPRAGLLFKGVALAHPHRAVPNLLATPEERRQDERRQRITNSFVIVSLLGVLLSFIIACTTMSAYIRTAKQVAEARSELSTMGPLVTLAEVTAEKARFDQLAALMSKQLLRELGPALIAEVSELAGPFVNYTRIEYLPDVKPGKSAKRTAHSGKEAAKEPDVNADPVAASFPRTVELDGFVRGNALEREVRLAEYLQRLENSILANHFEVLSTESRAERLLFRIRIIQMPGE